MSKKGKESDFNTKNNTKKIQTIEDTLTLLKSVLLISIKSFIRGPSPATKAFLSYFFTISSTISTCLFKSSLAIS